MPEDLILKIPASLNQFLQQSDLDYRESISSIPLFKPEMTNAWTKEQKKKSTLPLFFTI